MIGRVKLPLVGPRLETVKPAIVALEPSFLTARPAATRMDDGQTHTEEVVVRAPECPGCGRVHRDRLVRFFQLREVGSTPHHGRRTLKEVVTTPRHPQHDPTPRSPRAAPVLYGLWTGQLEVPRFE